MTTMDKAWAEGLVPAHPQVERTAYEVLSDRPVELTIRIGGREIRIHEVDLAAAYVVHSIKDWEVTPFRGSDLLDSHVILVGRMVPQENGEVYLMATPDYRRGLIEAALMETIADHPMWEGVEYTVGREARIAEFVTQASGAIEAAL